MQHVRVWSKGKTVLGCYLDMQEKKLWTKTWVLLTFPTCAQPLYPLQSHSRLTQPPVLPSTSFLANISPSPPPDDIHCQTCQSPFDEHQMFLCDICNAGWHMDCLLPPLTAIPHGTWKCPLCTPHNLLTQTVTRHLRLPSPILDFNSDSNTVASRDIETTEWPSQRVSAKNSRLYRVSFLLI